MKKVITPGEAWKSIPKYEGIYWINKKGDICNRSGKILKPRESSDGKLVELRKNGQRELVSPQNLLEEINEASSFNGVSK